MINNHSEQEEGGRAKQKEGRGKEALRDGCRGEENTMATVVALTRSSPI